MRACYPGIETLEGRRLPAQFGVPWHYPDHLTVSFVPDGTSIAGQPSDLFRALDAAQPTADWQQEVLRAFQTWAVNAQINFALKADGGEPLGTPGPDQGDPRFGDIRIGALPLPPGVLSISVPHDPFLSGTLSGDILLNSAVPSVGQEANLFPILLHEVGHVLGLGESSDPTSVMFEHLNHQVSLAPSDIAAVRALYGPREEDPFEAPSRNDTPSTATPMPTPAGFDGSTPLLIYANLLSLTDVDFFTLKAPDDYQGPLTIRLQTAGVSLLAPHLTVSDAAGNVLGDVSSGGEAGDTLLVHLPQAEPGATYRIEVRGARNDIFGIGEYVLATTFDARTTVGPDAIDTLARQSYDYLSPADIRAIFLDPTGALFQDDHHTNDTFATATPLYPVGVYGSEAPDRVTASLGDPTDVDVYHIETPEKSPNGEVLAPPLVLTVTVRATEVNGIMPQVAVFDAQHHPLSALILAHGDGTDTIQVADASPDSGYFIRVSSDPTSGKVVGNYDLDVEYGHVAASPTTFVGSSVEGATPQRSYELVVTQSQLFDFLLSATAPAAATAAPDATLRMVLTDGTGQVVATRTAENGGTAGGDPVLLGPGVYFARFVAAVPGGGPPPAMSFLLYGSSLSDPIGPALDDPTLSPVADPIRSALAATLPPILGSSDNPYSWLALGLSTPPVATAAFLSPLQAEGSRGASGLAGRDAELTTVVGVADRSSAPILVGFGAQAGAVPIRDVAPGVAIAPTNGATAALPARVVVTYTVAPVSPTRSFNRPGPLPHGDRDDPLAELPGAPGGELGPGILRSPPESPSPERIVAWQPPRPPPSLVAAPPQGQERSQEVPASDAASPQRSEVDRLGPDSVQTIAALWIAAMIYGGTHSLRISDGAGPRSLRSRVTSSWGLRTSRLCDHGR